MGLEKVMISMLVGVVKSSEKLDEKIDLTTEQASLPETDLVKLGDIVNQYNVLNSSLSEVKSVLSPLNSFVSTLEGIATTAEAAQIVIKTIPFPTSTPPGAGIPANVLTIYSDVLDKLDVLLKTGKNNGESMGEVIGIVSGYFDNTDGKLGGLDGAINDRLDVISEQDAIEIYGEPTAQQILTVKTDNAAEINYPI